MSLDQLRLDCAIKQKKGLHFILASILIWALVTIIHLTQLPILTKNLLTFSATAPLVPLAYFISKWIKVNFTDKSNPLNHLGIIFSLNQMLYQSRIYAIMSILIPFVALYVGLNYEVYILSGLMIICEILFSFILFIEVKNL